MQFVNTVQVYLFNALVDLPCTWIQHVVQCRLVRPPLDSSVEFDVSMSEWTSHGIWSFFRIVTGWFCPKRRLRSLDPTGMWSYGCSSTMSSRVYRGRADDRSNWFLTFEKSYVCRSVVCGRIWTKPGAFDRVWSNTASASSRNRLEVSGWPWKSRWRSKNVKYRHYMQMFGFASGVELK
jgi:hypothetical protein